MDKVIGIVFPKVHKGVSLITWATSVRWIGWGFFETLMPVFYFSFVGSYAETGLIKSVYSLSFLLVLPLVGVLANHVRSKYIILMGLAMYPFIGLSYYFAGAFGVVLLVVLARLLNGVGYALDSVGRATYIRKHSEREHVGSAFGFLDTIANFWWMAAVLAGMVLINYFEIHELMLAIIPTTLIAMYLVSKVPWDPLDYTETHWEKYISLSSYKNFIKEVLLWNTNLKKMLVYSFVGGVIFSTVNLFIPLQLLSEGESLDKIIIFMLLYTIPSLFSSSLGWVADRLGTRAIHFSFLALSILIALIAFAELYALKLLLIFLISFVGVLLYLTIDVETTRRGDARHYGSLGGARLEIGEIASILGPILMGIVIDIFSIKTAFLGLAIVILLATSFVRIENDVKLA